MIAWLALAMLAPATPIADQRRLSPAEVERILEEAARKRVAADKILPPRAVEGEVGVSIGTGGYRELFGTAVVPVGKDGTAIISVGGEQSDRQAKRPR